MHIGFTSLTMFISVIFVLLSFTSVEGHPQCLDSRPPFESETKLAFCPQYSEYGCCTNAEDSNLRRRFNQIEHLIPREKKSLWARCSNYAKTFLCQHCSPYAAHIFDSEVQQYGSAVVPRAFPGLCHGYCTNFYWNCRDIVKYYMDEAGGSYEEYTKLNTAVQQSESSFCNAISVSDVDYCYPELLTNGMLNGNISIETTTKQGCICVEAVVESELRNPIFLLHANDSSNRMFVGEQIGLVWIYYPNGTRLSRPFVNMTHFILTTSSKGDERGMLGMRFHPNYKQNGLFYIYYSTFLEDSEYGQGNHKTLLEEFRVDPINPNEMDYHYGKVLLGAYQPYWNHNGGEVLFGDDGFLYLFVGDGGLAGDPHHSGQDLTTFLGKVLRIEVIENRDPNNNNATLYHIPADNPFVNRSSILPEIYAYGVRNIWRCGKDRGDPATGEGAGRILCGDVGQSAREEIDLIEAGANYGWNLKEGNADYCNNAQCTHGLPEIKLTAPVFDYPHSVGKSVTGGEFYRGCHSPNLNGFYIYGDYMNGKLFRLLQNSRTKVWENKQLTMCGADRCKPPLQSLYSTSILSFGADEDGEVYMLSTGIPKTNTYQGSVYRFVDPYRRGNPAKCRSARPNEQPTPTPRATPRATTPPTPKPTTKKVVNSATVPKFTVFSGKGKGQGHSSVAIETPKSKPLNTHSDVGTDLNSLFSSFSQPKSRSKSFIELSKPHPSVLSIQPPTTTTTAATTTTVRPIQSIPNLWELLARLWRINP